MLARLFRNKDTHFVYIATNISKTDLATGISNKPLRVDDPGEPSEESFLTGMDAPCIYWIYYERHSTPDRAWARKLELDKLSLEEKVLRISEMNVGWKFLNTARL